MNKFEVKYQFTITKGTYKNLEYKIDLPSVPTFFRSFKYTWEKTSKLLISGPLSPKILKFQNGKYLMANRYLGTWIYDPETPLILKWIVVSKETQPFFRYDEIGKRHWLNVDVEFENDVSLEIVETKTPFEVSFSKIPFKPVLIFTDHCDFDSDLLLRKQREFFKDIGIKTTKGFFLKKHSHKGDWNSALEGNEIEYKKWLEDGHELCYHSLSQSKMPNNGNELLFNNFTNPFGNVKIRTWIDHGYQSYNIAKIKNLFERKERLRMLCEKEISIIWNYFDVAEAVDNLNQLDYEQITSRRIISSKIKLIDKLRIIYFFNATEIQILVYRNFASIIHEKKVLKLINLILGLFWGLFQTLLKSISIKTRIMRAQSIFQTENPSILGFQSIIVKDWVHSFDTPYSRLKKENGLAIIHTYFSFLGKHHRNTLFINEKGEIGSEVRKKILQIKMDIENKELWNPTLSEYLEFVEFLLTKDYIELKEKADYRCIN